MVRDTVMEPSVHIAQLQEGTKTLKQHGRKVNLVVAEHKVTIAGNYISSIIEVIAISKCRELPSETHEAPRLYLSYSKVFKRLHPSQLLKGGSIVSEDSIFAQALVSDYILSHIRVLKKPRNVTNAFEIEVAASSSEMDENLLVPSKAPMDILHEGPLILAQLPHIENVK